MSCSSNYAVNPLQASASLFSKLSAIYKGEEIKKEPQNAVLTK